MPTPRTIGRVLLAVPVLCAGGGCWELPDSGAVEPPAEAKRAAPPPAPFRLPEGTSVMLVTLDTTRRDHLSCYNSDCKLTPNLDRLARIGIRFDQAYSQANSTNLSHLSIMSGLPAIRHGVFSNLQSVPPELQTLPLMFKAKGWQTAGFPAVTHVGSAMKWRGFEHMPSARGQINAATISDWVIAWFRGRRDASRPFFLWVHYFDPHVLYSPPRDCAAASYQGDPKAGDGPLLAEMDAIRLWDYAPIKGWLRDIRDPAYPPAMYAAEVRCMDREFGRLLDYLKDSGLLDTTVILVVADHGESLGEHGVYYDHFGLYETQIHIPFIMRVPGRPGGRVLTERVTHVDIVPTLAELFDLHVEDPGPGISFAPLLDGRSCAALEARDVMIFEAGSNQEVAVRRGDWKLIWRYAETPRRPDGPELYHLGHDPREVHNRADEQAARVAELKPMIEPWIRLGLVKPAAPAEAARREQLKALGYLPTGDK